MHSDSKRLPGEYVEYETERSYTPKLTGPSTNNLNVWDERKAVRDLSRLSSHAQYWHISSSEGLRDILFHRRCQTATLPTAQPRFFFSSLSLLTEGKSEIAPLMHTLAQLWLSSWPFVKWVCLETCKGWVRANLTQSHFICHWMSLDIYEKLNEVHVKKEVEYSSCSKLQFQKVKIIGWLTKWCWRHNIFLATTLLLIYGIVRNMAKVTIKLSPHYYVSGGFNRNNLTSFLTGNSKLYLLQWAKCSSRGRQNPDAAGDELTLHGFFFCPRSRRKSNRLSLYSMSHFIDYFGAVARFMSLLTANAAIKKGVGILNY